MIIKKSLSIIMHRGGNSIRFLKNIYIWGFVVFFSYPCFTEQLILIDYFPLESRGGKPPLILVARFARTNVADYVRWRFR